MILRKQLLPVARKLDNHGVASHRALPLLSVAHCTLGQSVVKYTQNSWDWLSTRSKGVPPGTNTQHFTEYSLELWEVSLYAITQRLGGVDNDCDGDNDYSCTKSGSLRWWLVNQVFIRKFPSNQQLWGMWKEQKEQRSQCDIVLSYLVCLFGWK